MGEYRRRLYSARVEGREDLSHVEVYVYYNKEHKRLIMSSSLVRYEERRGGYTVSCIPDLVQCVRLRFVSGRLARVPSPKQWDAVAGHNAWMAEQMAREHVAELGCEIKGVAA